MTVFENAAYDIPLFSSLRLDIFLPHYAPLFICIRSPIQSMSMKRAVVPAVLFMPAETAKALVLVGKFVVMLVAKIVTASAPVR